MTFDTTCVEIVIWLTDADAVETHIRVRSVKELKLVESLIRRGCFGLARKSSFGASLFHRADGLHSSSYQLLTKHDGRWVLNPTLVVDLRRLERERRRRRKADGKGVH
jgi:hypothetical protein